MLYSSHVSLGDMVSADRQLSVASPIFPDLNWAVPILDSVAGLFGSTARTERMVATVFSHSSNGFGIKRKQGVVV